MHLCCDIYRLSYVYHPILIQYGVLKPMHVHVHAWMGACMSECGTHSIHTHSVISSRIFVSLMLRHQQVLPLSDDAQGRFNRMNLLMPACMYAGCQLVLFVLLVC
jgi:hypothetical protein